MSDSVVSDLQHIQNTAARIKKNYREYKRELRTNDQMNCVVPLVKRKHSDERSF